MLQIMTGTLNFFILRKPQKKAAPSAYIFFIAKNIVQGSFLIKTNK